MLKPLTTSQIGKVLKKLAERDERIMTKKPGNKSCYYLPPMDKNVRFYRHVDDFKPALADVNVLEDTSAPKAS